AGRLVLRRKIPVLRDQPPTGAAVRSQTIDRDRHWRTLSRDEQVEGVSSAHAERKSIAADGGVVPGVEAGIPVEGPLPQVLLRNGQRSPGLLYIRRSQAVEAS